MIVIAIWGALGALGGVLTSSGLGPDAAYYGALLLFFVVLAIRANRSGDIVQYEDHVIVREISWTYRLPRITVDRFTVEVGRVPLYGWRAGCFLVAELVGGGLRSFKEFNAPNNEAGQKSINEVATSLNAAWHLGQ